VIDHARRLKIKGRTPTSHREKIPPPLCRRKKTVGRLGPDSPDDLKVIPPSIPLGCNPHPHLNRLDRLLLLLDTGSSTSVRSTAAKQLAQLAVKSVITDVAFVEEDIKTLRQNIAFKDEQAWSELLAVFARVRLPSHLDLPFYNSPPYRSFRIFIPNLMTHGLLRPMPSPRSFPPSLYGSHPGVLMST